MERILKLEPTDDMASIRGRINMTFGPRPLPADAEGEILDKLRLVLVIPRKNKTLRSLVNMKLLARLAKARAIEMAIVSGHPLVRDYAKETGIKAYATLQGAKLAGWVPRKTEVTAPTESAAPVVTPDEKSEVAAKQRVKPKKYRVIQGRGIGCFEQLFALGAVVIVAFVVIFGVAGLLPGAHVTITPIAQTVETNLVVRADPNVEKVDFQNLAFPARTGQVELEISGAIETIETELAPVGKATGEVVFINRTEDEQIIPISTTISTSAGEAIQFITAATATIPAGIDATTSTLAIALEPGPGGNIQAGVVNRFEDSRFGLVSRVVNEQPFSGGTMEAAQIVVEDDKPRLQDHLRELIREEGLAQLEASLAEQEFVSLESLQVIVLDVTYEEFSGDFSDTFSGEMQAVVRGTVVGGYNANRLALAALQAQVPAGYELDIEGLHFGAGEILETEDQAITFRIFADGKVIPVIDPVEVASAITWLSVGEAQARLTELYDLATVPGIELGPEWAVEYIGRLPYIPLRIQVTINEAVTLMAADEG